MPGLKHFSKEIFIEFWPEKSVNGKIVPTLVILNGGLEHQLSALQLKHWTGICYGSKAVWTNN